MPAYSPMRGPGSFVSLPEVGSGFVNIPESGGGFVTFPESGGGFFNPASPHLKRLVPESGALPEYFANLCAEGVTPGSATEVQLAVQGQLDAGTYNAADWIGCVNADWLPGGAADLDYSMPGDASWADINKEVQSWLGGVNKMATDWYSATNPTEEDTPPSDDVLAGSVAPLPSGGVPTWAIVGGIGAAVLLLAVVFRK